MKNKNLNNLIDVNVNSSFIKKLKLINEKVVNYNNSNLNSTRGEVKRGKDFNKHQLKYNNFVDEEIEKLNNSELESKLIAKYKTENYKLNSLNMDLIDKLSEFDLFYFSNDEKLRKSESLKETDKILKKYKDKLSIEDNDPHGRMKINTKRRNILKKIMAIKNEIKEQTLYLDDIENDIEFIVNEKKDISINKLEFLKKYTNKSEIHFE